MALGKLKYQRASLSSSIYHYAITVDAVITVIWRINPNGLMLHITLKDYAVVIFVKVR